MSESRVSRKAPVIARISPAPAATLKQFPMLPWFPANFMASTRGWCLTARGIYRELLDCQWEMLEGLPAEPAVLQRLIGATNSEWRHWLTVEFKFPIGHDGMRRNARLEAHRANSINKSEMASDAAKTRWRRHREGKDAANANA